MGSLLADFSLQVRQCAVGNFWVESHSMSLDLSSPRPPGERGWANFMQHHNVESEQAKNLSQYWSGLSSLRMKMNFSLYRDELHTATFNFGGASAAQADSKRSSLRTNLVIQSSQNLPPAPVESRTTSSRLNFLIVSRETLVARWVNTV